MPNIKTKDGIVIQGIPQEAMGNEPLLRQMVASLRASSGEGSYNFADVMQAQARPEGTGTSLTGTPEQQAQLTPPDPATTVGGALGGAARAAGPTGIAAAIGLPLAAAERITHAITPFIADFVNEKLGLKGTKYEQMNSQEMYDFIADKMGVERPDTPAEQLVASGARGAAEALGALGTGGALQIGKPALGTGSLAQGVGKVLAEQPLKQVVGGALSGVGAEGGAQIAESKDMGPVGSILLPLGLGLAGDIAGTGLVDAATRVNKLITARGMDLPDAAAEAIRLSQGRGEIFLSDIDPKTSGAEAGRSFRETTSGGTQDLRLQRNFQRRQNIYDTMDDFGVVEGDYYARDIVDDFITKRGDLVDKWKGEKTEVIERLSHGGMDIGEDLPVEYTVDISKTLDLIESTRADLSSLNDSSLQPIINTLTNWEGSLDGKNLVQIEFLRKRLRNAFKDPNLAAVKDDGSKLAKKVYDSLNQEMGEYITKQGGPEDFRKWKTSNEALASMMGDFEISAVQNLIKKGEFTPSLITSFMRNNDKEMLETLYDGLSTEGRNRARSAIMADMAKDATDLGDLSPNQFAREIADQGEKHRVFFREEDGAQLEGLRKWLEITKRDEFSAGSAARPGSQLPGGQYALARGLWADPRIGIPVALAGKLGAGKFSKWLERGDVRDLMIKYAAIPEDKIATAGQELGKRIGEMYRSYMAATEDNQIERTPQGDS